jgi:hypothetical protein
MMYFLKIIATLFGRRNEDVKARQVIYQSSVHKLIVSKVNFVVALFPAIVATIILVDFLAAQLDVLNFLDALPEWMQPIFMMPAVVIMAFGPVGLLAALLLVPLGYYWTYKILTSEDKNSNASFN